MIPTPEQAYALVCDYNEGEFHRKHARIVGDVMRWYANELGYGAEADFWQTVGILHDLDFEQWPEQHCTKEQELMREKGIDERIIHATASHGWNLTVDIKPEHEMEKVLYAADELTGLIGACAIMLPSKSVQDLEVKSLKKKALIPVLRRIYCSSRAMRASALPCACMKTKQQASPAGTPAAHWTMWRMPVPLPMTWACPTMC